MSIKKKVLTAIKNSGRKGLKREGLLQAVWEGQGNSGKHCHGRGYYSMNFNTWLSQGLMYRPKRGVYKITNLGKVYLENEDKYKLIRLERKMSGIEYRHSMEIRELRHKLSMEREAIDRERSKKNVLMERIELYREKVINLERKIANSNPNGVYKNSQAIYFMYNDRIIIQLKTGGMFKTEDKFMGGAKRVGSLSDNIMSEFDSMYNNLKEY